MCVKNLIYMYKVHRGTLGIDKTQYMDCSFKKASDRDTGVNFDPYGINHLFKIKSFKNF